jgi:predicted alpha/beta-hydrolase family hydrolase
MGDPLKLRDKVLLDLATPVLFVQGTRDALCPLDLLEGVRPRMRARNELFVVEGGDHSLRVQKRILLDRLTTQDTIDTGIVEAIATFTKSLR